MSNWRDALPKWRMIGAFFSDRLKFLMIRRKIRHPFLKIELPVNIEILVTHT